MTERPNVILILTDDQGYGDLSCTGNPVLKTPHLDQLYDKSVAFQLSLKAGSTRVQTWFDDGIDAPPGAYYVYIKRISPA